MTLKERIEIEKRDWISLKKALKRKRNKELLKLINKLEESGIADKIDEFFEPIEEKYKKYLENKELKRVEKEELKQEKIMRKKIEEQYYEDKEREDEEEFNRKMNEALELMSDAGKIIKISCKKLHINKKTIAATLGTIILCQSGYMLMQYKKHTMDSYIIVKAPTYVSLETVKIGYEASKLPQDYINGKTVQRKNADGTDYAVGFVATQKPELKEEYYRLPVNQEIPKGAKEFTFEETDNAFINLGNYFKMWKMRSNKDIETTNTKLLEEKISAASKENEKHQKFFESTLKNTCKTEEEAIQEYLNRPEEEIRYYYVEPVDYEEKVKHYVYHR